MPILDLTSMQIRHWFLPHPYHHKKGHLISEKGFFAYAVVFLLISVYVLQTRNVHGVVLSYATNISAEEIIKYTNQERAKAGANPVIANARLANAADAKARDMFAKNYWAHFGPNGESPWDFIQRAGYTYVAAGENLARSFQDSQAVVTAWMNSPSHKENLLNKNYQDIGVAVLNGTLLGEQTTLVVQEFGKPYQQDQLTQAATTVTAFTSSSPSPSGLAPAMIAGSVQMPPPSLARTFTSMQTIDRFALARALGLSLIGITIVILAIDSYAIHRRGVSRLATHSMAHIAILVVVAFGLLLLSNGKVI